MQTTPLPSVAAWREVGYTKPGMRWALGLLVIAVTASCGGTVCAVRSLLTGTDAGVMTCVQATDCPRPANVLVCGATEDQLRDCVGCEQNQCVRYQPGACK